MSIDAIISNLGALAVVKSGYPFRGSIEEAADADALAVQMKDVDPEHGVSWPGVTRTALAK